ncbi:MAG: sensor domain-containing diguanylate cyclase [Candidatus Gastranaerophilaceae bacterium]
MSKKNEKSFALNFLWEVSKVLSDNFVPEDIVLNLKTVFNKFFKTIDLKIYLYDKASDSLRDFTKTWFIISDKHQNSYYMKLFVQLTASVKHRFMINDNFIIINDDFTCFSDIKLEKNKNSVYLPIVQKLETVGMIEIILPEIKGQFLSKDLLTALIIATSEISTSIVNYRLNHTLSRNTHFYRSMKDIAKILENQYELSYIIPMIGEIIDKFTSEHLVYIFEKQNENINLLWPGKYDQERILPVLGKMVESKKLEISTDSTIGAFPLYFDNELKGAIVADGKNTKLSKQDIEYLTQLTRQASITIDKANTYAEIQKYAALDALTGLYNRRSLELKLKQEIAVAKRKNTPLCCMMLDIDYFKNINDTYGHSAGDFILKEFSAKIIEEIREYDFAARYGGEEFCIILPSSTIEEANAVALRLQHGFKTESYDISQVSEKSCSVSITASIGIAEFEQEYTPDELCRAADKALYEAKQTGRNKVVIFL